jgi:hypothetical protein
VRHRYDAMRTSSGRSTNKTLAKRRSKLLYFKLTSENRQFLIAGPTMRFQIAFWLTIVGFFLSANDARAVDASPPAPPARDSRGSGSQLPQAGDLSGLAVDLDSHTSGIQITPDTLNRAQLELVLHRLTIGRYDGKDAKGSHDASYERRFDELLSAARVSDKYKFGAYHVLFPSPSGRDNGEQQARGFLVAVADFCPDHQKLLLAVDWESVDCFRDGKTRSCGIPDPSYLKSFVNYVVKQTGKRLLIYTFANVLNEYADSFKQDGDLTELVTRQPLWFAQPRRDFVSNADNRQRRGYFFPQPVDYAPWQDWTFWQFSAAEDKLRVRPTQAISMTIGGQPADFNWYNGGRAQFPDFFNDMAIDCKSIDPSRLPAPDHVE